MFKMFPCRPDQLGMFPVLKSLRPRVCLTWRRGMNGIKGYRRILGMAQELEYVISNELKRVSRLRLNVNANNIETGAVVTHRCAASAAE